MNKVWKIVTIALIAIVLSVFLPLTNASILQFARAMGKSAALA